MVVSVGSLNWMIFCCYSITKILFYFLANQNPINFLCRPRAVFCLPLMYTISFSAKLLSALWFMYKEIQLKLIMYDCVSPSSSLRSLSSVGWLENGRNYIFLFLRTESGISIHGCDAIGNSSYNKLSAYSPPVGVFSVCGARPWRGWTQVERVEAWEPSLAPRFKWKRYVRMHLHLGVTGGRNEQLWTPHDQNAKWTWKL